MDKEPTLSAKIEALLFYKGEPVSIERLSEWTGSTGPEVEDALTKLDASLSNRGLILMRKDGEVMLGSAPAVSPLIEKITKEELSRELGKAGLETLSIVLYMSPISRKEIDYIRGVNSQFILRNLSARGLVEKIEGKDIRGYQYRPTFELLSYMGAKDVQELPDYEAVRKEIEAFRSAKNEEAIEIKHDNS